MILLVTKFARYPSTIHLHVVPVPRHGQGCACRIIEVATHALLRAERCMYPLNALDRSPFSASDLRTATEHEHSRTRQMRYKYC